MVKETVIDVTKVNKANTASYSIKTTIPAEVARKLGLKEKDQLIWEEIEITNPDGSVERFIVVKAQHRG